MKRYNKDGECIDCDKDQLKKMKSIGYDLKQAPAKKENIQVKSTKKDIQSKIEKSVPEVEPKLEVEAKPEVDKKSKKDIIL